MDELTDMKGEDTDTSEGRKTTEGVLPLAVKIAGLAMLLTGILWIVASLLVLSGAFFVDLDIAGLFLDDYSMIYLFGILGFVVLGLVGVLAGIGFIRARKTGLSLAIATALMGLGIGIVLISLSTLVIPGVAAVLGYMALLFYLIAAPSVKETFPSVNVRYVRAASQFSFLFLLNATVIGSLYVSPLLPILRFRHMAGAQSGVPLCSVGSLARCLSGNWFGLFFPVAVLGVLFLVGLFVGRAMCGWLCPIGFLQDIITKIRTRLHIGSKEPSQKSHEKMTMAKYAFLFLFLLLAISIGLSVLAHADIEAQYKSQFSELPLIQSGATPCETCPGPIMGHFMPDDFISNSLEGQFVLTTEAALRLSVFAGFIIGASVMGRFYCRYLCPSGAMISLFNKGSMLAINKDQGKCTKCNYCVTNCPMRVARLKDEDVDYEIRDRECTFCLECIDSCPEKALSLNFANKEVYKGGDEWWQKES